MFETRQEIINDNKLRSVMKIRKTGNSEEISDLNGLTIINIWMEKILNIN